MKIKAKMKCLAIKYLLPGLRGQLEEVRDAASAFETHSHWAGQLTQPSPCRLSRTAEEDKFTPYLDSFATQH